MTDKIVLSGWFDEEDGRATRFFIGDQNGREVGGAVVENITEERMYISVPIPKASEIRTCGVAGNVNSTRVVAAWPGTGKSTMSAKYSNISDLDSSYFDKASFPGNYIAQIKLQEARFGTFVSSHLDVRNAMVEAGIDFWLVYPIRECKAEYLQRYRDRGSPQSFIELLDKNWDAWIAECEQQTASYKIRLHPGQFLEEVIQYDEELGRFKL